MQTVHPHPRSLALRSRHLAGRCRLVAAVLPALLTTALAVEDAGSIAVYSCVSPAYVRTVLPGGTFKPETFAFGEGGKWGGALNDYTLDQLRFLDVVRIITPMLARRNYVPATSKDPRQTDLLIMVYWGTTSGTADRSASEYQIAQGLMGPPTGVPAPAWKPDASVLRSCRSAGPCTALTAPRNDDARITAGARESAAAQADLLIQMSNQTRDRQNRENAAILGFLPEMDRVADYRGTALDRVRQDVIDDVEENRHFVVLLAYDFRTLWESKQRKLLWETRFSIRERHNEFDEALAVMAQQASQFFGQNSHGLVRTPVREGRVKIGDLKVTGYDSPPKE